MDYKEKVKLLQVADQLVAKHEFRQIVTNYKYDTYEHEIWVANDDDKNYQIIRITSLPATNNINDRFVIDLYIRYLKTITGKNDISFLDIHVNNEPYNKEDEQSDFINLEENYADGIDLHNIYPEIYDSIKQVDNAEEEYKILQEKIIKAGSRKPSLKRILKKFAITYSLIGICILMFIIAEILKTKYPDTAVYVFLGADYKTFTLGLKQLFRLITCGFLHGNILHLFSNMYSLYICGRHIEKSYGKKDYFLIVLYCLIVSSLTQEILSENTIMIGFSGVLYGLIIILIVDLLKKGMINFTSIMPLILINLAINFLDTTAWIAHLGGGICGFLISYYYWNKKDKKIIYLLGVMLLVLVIKYLTVKTINPLYQGTDMQIAQLYADLGFKQYSEILLKKLAGVYARYGG